MKYVEDVADVKKSFDYTFDYLLMPVAPARIAELESYFGVESTVLRSSLQAAGYTLAKRNREQYVEDFPVGRPSVIEIMTCSTSGGNKANRSTIPMAFEDAILRKPHTAPGINYRQVWARMVSQLIVKSEVAIGWGGSAVWILQDVLISYISGSTALDIRQFAAEHVNEVNILSFSYEEGFGQTAGPISLSNGSLFSGPISGAPVGSKQGFQEIVRAPVTPPISRLLRLLSRRAPISHITV